jgi:hypothetical protein
LILPELSHQSFDAPLLLRFPIDFVDAAMPFYDFQKAANQLIVFSLQQVV